MDAAEQARSVIAEGATMEDVLARLRQAGYDQAVLESETFADEVETEADGRVTATFDLTRLPECEGET